MKKVSLLSLLVAISFFLTCSLLPSTSYAHRISATSGVFSAVSQGPDNDNMPGMKTIMNTLTNGATNFRTMDWQNTDAKATYLKGGIASQKSLQGKFETALATTEANGSVSVIAPLGEVAAFQANIHATTRAAPAAKPPPGESESRNSELSEIFGATVTSLIEFTSTLTTIDTGLFEYEYKVVTSSVSPITFTWASAGLTGVVSQDEPFTQIFDSVASPLEVVDGASFLLNGADTFLIATAFAPILEPSAFFLFGSGLVVLMIFAERKVNKKGKGSQRSPDEASVAWSAVRSSPENKAVIRLAASVGCVLRTIQGWWYGNGWSLVAGSALTKRCSRPRYRAAAELEALGPIR